MIDRVLITLLNVKNVNNKNTTSNYVNLFSLLLNLKLSISRQLYDKILLKYNPV